MSNLLSYPIHSFLILSIFIPFLTGIFCWKRIDPRFHAFIIYLGIGCVMEVSGEVLLLTNHYTRTSHRISNIIYLWLDAILLVNWLLRFGFTEKTRISKIQFGLILAGLMTMLLDYLLFGYDTYRLYLMHFLFTGVIIFLIIQLLVNMPRHAELIPFRRSLNWILIPLLISEIVFVFIVLFSFVTPIHHELQGIVSNIRIGFVLLNFFGYLSYSLALIWAPKRITFLSTSY
jgi:hypothetical protein